jgi:AcrR family transcriptional regulator
MSEQAGAGGGRARLSRDRVLGGAMAVADAGGIASLTIRSIAQELGVKPMSVYHHVANKDAIIDGIVDLVFSEIDLPVPGRPWKPEIRRRSVSAREALARHPWAIQLLQSRTNPGQATLRHHNAVIGTMREAGYSVVKTAHALALVDSYVFGFALSEAALPIHGPDTVPEVAEQMMEGFDPAEYPYLVDFAVKHIVKPGYDFGAEFEYGLTRVLDALS